MAERSPYIILVSGARDWHDKDPILRELGQLKDKYHGRELLVITGGADGADTLCKLACDELDIHCAVMTALWGTRHRSAGPQRNKAMALLVGWDRLNLVLAFHKDISRSKGTKDMTKLAKKNLVRTKVVKR